MGLICEHSYKTVRSAISEIGDFVVPKDNGIFNGLFFENEERKNINHRCFHGDIDKNVPAIVNK